jgi:hypothetical protein
MLLGAALITSAATFAAAQAVVPVQWTQGYNNDYDRQAFNDGYRQGQWDAQHGRRFNQDNGWRDRGDRQAYRSGYERGFNEAGAYRGARNVYGGDYALNSARDIGYQDGLNDGTQDRRTGRSFRPTNSGNFKHADRGYIPTYGNKNYYKDTYREAYQNGYSQGYNNGGYQRRY